MASKTKKSTNTQLTNKVTKITKETPELIYVQPEIQTIYVNHAQLAFSSYDASLVIGEIGGLHEKGMVVHPRAKLLMSHTFLKELAELLNRNIDLRRKNEESSENDKSGDENKSESAD
jgi:hypothetical protein